MGVKIRKLPYLGCSLLFRVVVWFVAVVVTVAPGRERKKCVLFKTHKPHLGTHNILLVFLLDVGRRVLPIFGCVFPTRTLKCAGFWEFFAFFGFWIVVPDSFYLG